MRESHIFRVERVSRTRRRQNILLSLRSLVSWWAVSSGACLSDAQQFSEFSMGACWTAGFSRNGGFSRYGTACPFRIGPWCVMGSGQDRVGYLNREECSQPFSIAVTTSHGQPSQAECNLSTTVRPGTALGKATSSFDDGWGGLAPAPTTQVRGHRLVKSEDCIGC